MSRLSVAVLLLVACSTAPTSDSVCAHASAATAALMDKQAPCFKNATSSVLETCGVAVCDHLGPCSDQDNGALQDWLSCIDALPDCTLATASGWVFEASGCYQHLGQLSNACTAVAFANSCSGSSGGSSGGTSGGRSSSTGGGFSSSSTGSSGGSSGGSTGSVGGNTLPDGAKAVIGYSGPSTVCASVSLNSFQSDTNGSLDENTFTWKLTGPAGSAATITSDASFYNENASFTPDAIGDYNVELDLHDGSGIARATQVVHVAAAATMSAAGVVNNNGAAIGSSDFAISVFGAQSDFVCNPVITFNGVALASAPDEFGELSATIPAAMLTTPGIFDVTVHRGPPMSDDSPASSFAVYVPLASNALFYEPITDRLYASLPSTVGANGNSLAHIDPATGDIVKATFVGSEPGTIAASDDGSFLYVGLTGADAVRRFNLASEAAEIQFSVGAGVSSSNYVAASLAVLPGAAHTLAVAKSNATDPTEVVIFDDGVARANSVSIASPTVFLGFDSSATTLYATASTVGLERLTVAVDGVTSLDVTASIGATTNAPFLIADGTLYSPSGEIVDLSTPGLAATLAGSGSGVAVDATLGRVFILALDFASQEEELLAFTSDTFIKLGEEAIPSFESTFSDLVHFGSDSFALRTSDRIYIFHSALSR